MMNKEQEIFVGNLLKELGPDQLQDDSENLFLRDSNEQEITMVEEGVELPVAVCVGLSIADIEKDGEEIDCYPTHYKKRVAALLRVGTDFYRRAYDIYKDYFNYRFFDQTSKSDFNSAVRIVIDTKAREAKVDCTADEFNEMVEKFKEPFKPYWTPCIELFLW